VQKLSFRYFQIEIYLVDSQIEKRNVFLYIKKIMGFATIQIIRLLVKLEKNWLICNLYGFNIKKLVN